MPGIDEKIELLKKIARRFNEFNVTWALGASMMLYLKGIAREFHDIDLMISNDDVEIVRIILSDMGEIKPANQNPNPMFHTKSFMEFTIDTIDVDVMAGFSIINDAKLFDYSLQKEQIVEKILLETELIPLQSPLLWCEYYRLMGRNEKVDMIERAVSKEKNSASKSL